MTADAQPANGFARLRARGAPEDVIDAIAASGLPGEFAAKAVAATGAWNRLRLSLRPTAPLTTTETTRLAAIAELAAEVAKLHNGPEGAARWWAGPMPWLGGHTPAETLTRRDGISIVADLVNRIAYGIPP